MRLVLQTACVLAALIATPLASAQQQEFPRRIPAAGGEVILPSQGAQRAYDSMHYASSRRVGDTLYISGVIAGGGRPGAPADAETFRASLRRAFEQIRGNLTAAGAGFGDVVMINSFHVFTSPNFTGTKDEHFAIVSAVKDEFMPAPHPAWTAVGTTELLASTGLVEIQVIAHAPRR